MIPFSILDLSPVAEGSTPRQALRNTLSLAQRAESLGYKRFWLAEHHNMPGIASAATSVVMGYVAGGTQTIMVGSGGVMLPNHAPLVIAEQFGTLESLYPGRIELGLGRAPGTDGLTARALRRTLDASPDDFPRDVVELQAYFEPATEGQRVTAVPGEGLRVPIWLLGSSLFSAQLAAYLGLPFAFASHFAPDALMQALDIYRRTFQPSARLEKPYAMVAANIFAAETDEKARFYFTSVQQHFVRLRRGNPGQVPPPVESMDGLWTPLEKAGVDHALSCSFVGAKRTIAPQIAAFLKETQADELIVSGHFYDPAARLSSLEITAEIRDGLTRQPSFSAG